MSNKVKSNFTEIVTAVGKVNEVVTVIATASREQAVKVEAVNQVVARMDSVVQSSASSAEEGSSTSEELAAQAHSLSGMVGRFRLRRNEGGRHGSREMTVLKGGRMSKEAANLEKQLPLENDMMVFRKF